MSLEYLRVPLLLTALFALVFVLFSREARALAALEDQARHYEAARQRISQVKQNMLAAKAAAERAQARRNADLAQQDLTALRAALDAERLKLSQAHTEAALASTRLDEAQNRAAIAQETAKREQAEAQILADTLALASENAARLRARLTTTAPNAPKTQP